MKSRTKKYYQTRSQESGEKKGSVSEAGYNEENEVTSRQDPKKNPAPPQYKKDSTQDSLSSHG
ncbi:MAG: hypothetical protein ABIY62_08925 [Ginsengibacter sp.]